MEDYLSIGAHLHISRKAWLIHVTKKLPSGTRLRCRKGKLTVAATIFLGQKVTWKRSNEIRFTVLPAQGRTRSSRNIFGQDRSDGKTRVLVVQGNGPIGWAFIHQMPEMEERAKKTSQGIRKGRSFMASSGRKKMASRFTSKQKSSSTTIEIFTSNRCRRKRGCKRGVRGGAEKWPSGWRFAWVNPGGDDPKVAVIHSGEIKQKWKK